jgi:hypothetical protein
MDDFDAFIDYVDTIDEPGEVTVSVGALQPNEHSRSNKDSRYHGQAIHL